MLKPKGDLSLFFLKSNKIAFDSGGGDWPCLNLLCNALLTLPFLNKDGGVNGE